MARSRERARALSLFYEIRSGRNKFYCALYPRSLSLVPRPLSLPFLDRDRAHASERDRYVFSETAIRESAKGLFFRERQIARVYRVKLLP